ncbi:MAG: hypothetical protein KF800_08255 [Lysobacter sp.]|nr:hypothetical protein [Lysobacter sp.]
MAHAFAAFAVPDAHIHVLQQHPGLVHDYLDGAVPPSVAALPLPGGWPQEPLESLGSWGINHGNADLYHWILNGGPELAEGAGSIFQTWYEPDVHAALKLDPLNERFAFLSTQLPDLLALVDRVDVPRVQHAFVEWLKRRGERHDDIDQYACQPFVDEFQQFARGLQQAIARGDGLVW